MSDTQNTNNEDENVEDRVDADEILEPVVELKAQSAEAQINEWKSKAAYAAAELDNVKKRSVRERSETIKFANESLLKLVVPVLDNLTLALHSAKGAKEDATSSPMLKALVEGVEMTIRHFEQTLVQAGVEFIKAEGEPFDPQIHEAVGQAQDATKKDNIVIHEIQRGFKLSDRVVRSAKVIVNKLS